MIRFQPEPGGLHFFNKKNLILIFLILSGFVFRIFIVSYAEKRLYWDADSYTFMAREISAGKIAGDCCTHSLGYPALLAGIYALFGPGNTVAILLIQILMDMVTAGMVYLIAKRVFNNKTAYFSFIIYLFNPLTAAYTGYNLTETLMIFLITAIALTVTEKNFGIHKYFWAVTGFLLGLLTFVKSPYYAVSAVLIGSLSLFYFRKLDRIYFIIAATILFFFASGYSLYSYHQKYLKWSIIPPYSMGLTQLYLNFYPSGKTTMDDVFHEFYFTPPSEMEKFKQKYNDLFLKRFRTDWPLFVRNWFQNMGLIWDKTYLFEYKDNIDAGQQNDWASQGKRWYIRVGNVIAILLFFIGIFGFVKKEKSIILTNPFFIVTAVFFLCTTFVFTLFTIVQRHSIPFYSLLFIWSGYGIYCIFGWLRKRLRFRRNLAAA